ncbi:hypothetical protein D0Z07_2856 [Hyphodiscus hymeniophilus]|uniref:Uncharacterized protein n=1 Tax=Hyphodiscus hymeniophilus TaxID=353542 RepID=A0A9P7AZF9_9HELO|nr:hypothetical protein D0Z07_2856 [Hyphodiscus hymeniophilus]
MSRMSGFRMMTAPLRGFLLTRGTYFVNSLLFFFHIISSFPTTTPKESGTKHRPSRTSGYRLQYSTVFGLFVLPNPRQFPAHRRSRPPGFPVLFLYTQGISSSDLRFPAPPFPRYLSQSAELFANKLLYFPNTRSKTNQTCNLNLLPIMASHEELIDLFSRNLSFNPYVAPQQEPSQSETPIIYSITQHYHHSAHIAAQQPARPASEPPQTDQLTTEIILSRHGVDVASLTPAQLTLFKTADASQQMRLIQLWQLYNTTPTPTISQDLSNYQTTSFDQEEAIAKLRYERQMLEERMSRSGGDQSMDMEDSMSDESSTTPMPMTPIQGGDGRWAGLHVAEPYMSSGYEALARREYEQSAVPSKDAYSHFGTAVGGQTHNRATDPVYKSIEDVHKYPNINHEWQQQSMEDQYGAYAQFQHNHNGTSGGYNGDDEEML